MGDKRKMTKEELKQEAEEKAFNYADEQDVSTSTWVDKDYTYIQVVNAYEKGALDFAEPREKRIAELEKENAELKEHLKCLIVGMYHIAQHHPTMGAHTKIMQDLREAEQFISEVEK